MGDPEIATRINSFEMAYKMQSSAPELMDVAKESPETLKLYGAEPGKPSFAMNCLLARRLIERGVRFVQVFLNGQPWDTHDKNAARLKDLCAMTDQPSAGLVLDLKRRGLLDSTIVLWTGEFGRLPIAQGNDGRDHNNKGFSLWLAGGGVRPGIAYGQTDELGFGAPDIEAADDEGDVDHAGTGAR